MLLQVVYPPMLLRYQKRKVSNISKLLNKTYEINPVRCVGLSSWQLVGNTVNLVMTITNDIEADVIPFC